MSYTSIKIPKELADQIDDLISSTGEGYSSRAEFVKEAVREKIRANRPSEGS